MFSRFFPKRNKSPESPSGEPHDPKQDAQVAYEAFRQGNYPHAFFHISWALASDPANSEWRGLLEQINANVSDPGVLVPRDKQMDYARGAALAYLFAKQRRYAEAFGLMSSVLQAMPDTRYLAWIAGWFTVLATETDSPHEAVVLLLARLLAQFSGDYVENARNRQSLEQMIPAVEQALVQHPENVMLAVMASSLVRKAGHYEEARDIAQQAYTASPSQQTATMLAIAHRALGDLDQSVAMYRKALDEEPGDMSVRLDLGDMLCNAGRIEEGLAYYQQVLDIQKNHPWAEPHFLFFKAQLEPEGAWSTRLMEYLKAHPDSEAVHALKWRISPYMGYLPEPSDATVNLLRQNADKLRRDFTPRKSAEETSEQEPFSLTLSSLESPSARLALDLFLLETMGKKARVLVSSVPTPDPRVPFGDVDFVLWRYAGNDPEPAVPQATPSIAAAVAHIAVQGNDPNAYVRMAYRLGRKLAEDQILDLLGVMVHPPARPQGIEIWAWMSGLQVAAALTIAALNPQEPWLSSRRRRALSSLIRGPMDWTVEAALIALRQVGRENPELVPDIASLWFELLDHLPTSGGIPYLHALVYCGLSLPELPDRLEARLEAIQKTLK